jgi:uncharacterized protein (DUF302 family)
MENFKKYAFDTILDMPYEGAVLKATGTLENQGFGVLTEIDVESTLKSKLDVDFRKYVILLAR